VHCHETYPRCKISSNQGKIEKHDKHMVKKKKFKQQVLVTRSLQENVMVSYPNINIIKPTKIHDKSNKTVKTRTAIMF
jgi:hypothetical protein